MPIFLHVSYAASLSYAKNTFQNFTSDRRTGKDCYLEAISWKWLLCYSTFVANFLNLIFSVTDLMFGFGD